MIAVDWSSLTVAGAFGIGVAVGCVLTFRLLRVAVDIVREQTRNGPPDPR